MCRKEHQCLTAACHEKAAELRRELEHIEKPTSSLMPIALLILCWKRQGSIQIIGCQLQAILLFIPIVIYLVIERIGYHYRRLKLQQAIAKIERYPNQPPYRYSAPSVKRFIKLWQAYGLAESKYSPDTQIDMIKKWLEILYTEQKLQHHEVNVDEIVNKIRHDRHRMNKAYYDGDNNAPRFFFGRISDDLLNIINHRLPEYTTDHPQV
jgi:hypothetical protein